ncbi:hypothetical protein ACLK1S_18365 [Escherichia coli]
MQSRRAQTSKPKLTQQDVTDWIAHPEQRWIGADYGNVMSKLRKRARLVCVLLDAAGLSMALNKSVVKNHSKGSEPCSSAARNGHLGR